MTFIEPVTRVDGVTRYGNPTHHYEDGNGTRIPGVTTIIGDGLPKPALVGWGISSVASYAVDEWDTLTDLPPTEKLKALKGAPYRDRDKAARRGTEVHALADDLVNGREVSVPAELDGHVQAYLNFLDDWQVEPVLTEATVYYLGEDWAYAGTLDIIYTDRDGRTILADVKTNRGGVYGDTAFQLAAYRYAQSFLDGGEPHPMPKVDACAVIHVRGSGYSLVPVEAGEDQWNEFRHIYSVAMASKRAKNYLGAPLGAVTA
jgi:hypothetical protein